MAVEMEQFKVVYFLSNMMEKHTMYALNLQIKNKTGGVQLKWIPMEILRKMTGLVVMITALSGKSWVLSLT